MTASMNSGTYLQQREKARIISQTAWTIRDYSLLAAKFRVECSGSQIHRDYLEA